MNYLKLIDPLTPKSPKGDLSFAVPGEFNPHLGGLGGQKKIILRTFNQFNDFNFYRTVFHP